MFTGNKTTKKEQRPDYNKRMPTKNIVLIMPVCKKTKTNTKHRCSLKRSSKNIKSLWKKEMSSRQI